MAARLRPIPRSTVLPMLFVGGERAPVAVVGGLGIALVAMFVIGHQVVTGGAGLLFLTVGMYFVRRMAKADPMMVAVYLRHLPRRHYHRARSSVFRRG